jgi:ectoine hydroxylase-related dioxygenase (phytanoyl-CoA dioxygenase family)
MNQPVRIESRTAPRHEEREALLRDGFVVIRGLFDPRALTALNAEMDALFVLQLRRLGLPVDPGGTRESLHANAARLLAVDVPTYISTARMTQMLPSAHRLMASEALLDLVRDLGVEIPVVSTRLSNHIMSDTLRIPGGYHKSPPHQDWRSIQGSLDSLVVWAPTTPVTETTHPLQVVPRSHLLGLLNTVEHIMTPTVSDDRITDDQYLSLPMQPGDVVVFSTFLVHRTGETGDGSLRVAFSARFNNAAEATYVEHGYPTPYKYSYQTDLIVPDFPTPADIASIYPDAANLG